MRQLRRIRSLAEAEDGAVAVLVALLLPVVLLGMAAVAVDISWWYVNSAQVQKAADAAALAGVTYMPQDFANATSTAKATARSNGYPESRSGYVSTVTVSKTSTPSELRVTIRDEFDNFFGQVLGRSRMTIERTAVADFLTPAIMGSPCNALGNQPPSSIGAALPSGTTIPTQAQGGYATCQSPPGFWLRVAGPNEDKKNGDRYASKYCASGSTYGCDGNRNTEYLQEGYFYAIRVPAAAVGKKVSLQVYDPAFVQTGPRCNSMGSFDPSAATNGYEAGTGAARYATASSDDTQRRIYCPGDNASGPAGTAGPNTTFVLRQQTNTFDPLAADLVTCDSGSPITQFAAQRTAPTTASLTQTSSLYNDALSKVFHQWVALCTFTPSRAGDWYLQVRTNVSIGGTPQQNGFRDPIIYTGNPAADDVAANDDSPGASGHNSFSLRADVNADGIVTPDDALLSVGGYKRLGIYTSARDTQMINLIRVDPNAEGSLFEFSAFDIGDWSGSSGRLTVLPPIGSTNNGSPFSLPVSPSRCKASGYISDPDLANCSVVVNAGAWGGQLVILTVPIPPRYECSTTESPDTPSPGDCWFRVRFDFPSEPNEATTWDANLQGDPVRLRE